MSTGVDLDGNPRLVGATVDMGAFELQNLAPTAVCQDISVQLDGIGSATVTGTTLDGGSSDPDGDPLTFTPAPASFTCSDLGANTVVLTVDDGKGGSDTCEATVTVTSYGSCADLQDAVYNTVCAAAGSYTSLDALTASINQTVTTELAGSTICDVPLATCVQQLLVTVGLLAP